MPWIEATLRGQRVLARARDDGKLADESGRVEIRYKPTDAKAYRAAVRNLEVTRGAPLLPDDTCAAGRERAALRGARGCVGGLYGRGLLGQPGAGGLRCRAH